MRPELESLGLRWRRIRFNPLRTLTPERLSSAIDQWDAGWLREAALIYETIEKRDAVCRTVIPKRKRAVSRRPHVIRPLDPEDTSRKAKQHEATLRYFYDNLTVTDATDLNVRSGMAGLKRQMMDAAYQRYAVHEIVWRSGPAGLTAELRKVPLYFFENRSGRLRYVGPETRADGTPLAEGEWLVTTCEDSVGEAISICYMFRRLALQDWIAFSEKFSIPGVLFRTKAAKGSEEGNAARDAAADFGSEWNGIVYNDDGSIKDPVQVIQTAMGAGLPQQEMCDYMDRLMTILCRGGDLGTLSREDSQGASLQGDETDDLLEDDCAMVSEALQQLDRLVIRAVHGEDPLVRCEVEPPSGEDLEKDLKIDQGLSTLGVKQNPKALADRYGREHEEQLVETAPPAAPPAPESEDEDVEEEAANEAVQTVREALAADLQPLGEALAGAMAAGDLPAIRAALRKISSGLTLSAPQLEEAMGLLMARAFAGTEDAS